MKNKIAHTAVTHWQTYAKGEQIRLVYLLVLLLAMIFLPIMKLDYLTTNQVDSFTIFSAGMMKTAMITGLSVIFLLLRTGSMRFKKRIHELFGFT